VSRWSIRERLRHSVREHAWIWKAPFLFATVTIWVGGILLFLSPWQGDSRSPDRIRTVPSPASVEPDDSAGERGPLFTDPSRNGTAADGRQGGDSEPTDVGAPAPTGSALEVVSTLDVPVTGAVETASAATTRRSTGPTPAPPTVTSSAPVTGHPAGHRAGSRSADGDGGTSHDSAADRDDRTAVRSADHASGDHVTAGDAARDRFDDGSLHRRSAHLSGDSARPASIEAEHDVASAGGGRRRLRAARSFGRPAGQGTFVYRIVRCSGSERVMMSAVAITK
jgi:hypothetical protein